MRIRIDFGALLAACMIFSGLLLPITAIAGRDLPQNTATLDAVTISGPSTGKTNIAYRFVASVSPITVTTPITYVWESTGLAPTIHAMRLSVTDAMTFTWSAVGAKTITVTATSEMDTVSNTSTTTITYHKLYLAFASARWPPFLYDPTLNVIDDTGQDK